MSFGANVFGANVLMANDYGQMFIWANVFLDKCLSGETSSWQMSSGQISFCANVSAQMSPRKCLWANVSGQMSWGQMTYHRKYVPFFYQWTKIRS
jgi:hypothetical protein